MSTIVVGVDGSESAAVALRWAVAEGSLRGWEVTALLSWTAFDQHHPDRSERHEPDYDDVAALAALDTYVVDAVGAEAAAGVGRRVECDHPTYGLIDASATADLLVVGARGLGPFQRLLLGSTSHAVLQHATSPVAVIRSGDDGASVTGDGRVVAAVDGSVHSQHALEWAIDEARARDGRLHVIHVWTLPGSYAMVPMVPPQDVSALETEARQMVDDMLAATDAGTLATAPQVTIAHGQPAEQILEHARGASVLVIGSHGRGGFAGLLLGSVSSQVSQHAVGPVVVLRPREQD